MHELNTKYCIDCKPRVEITVKWEKLHVPSYTVLESVCACAYVLYNNVYICLQSFLFCIFFFVVVANHNKVETEPGRHKEERLVFVFNLFCSTVQTSVWSAHSRARGLPCIACRLLDCGREKKKKNLAGIQTGERSALLIIVSSLQVSQLTVGGGWGRGR